MAAKDQSQQLSAPLLSNNGAHSIITIHDKEEEEEPSSVNANTNTDNQQDSENPYGFLGAHGFELPGPTTVDPFKNETPSIDGLYEWVKILVLLPIALLRLVLFGLCLMVGYVATLCALQGWEDKQNPMPKWRCRVMWVTRFCSRGILFSFGYHWIRRKGRPAPRQIAPIVVSNHVSYIEPIFFFYELFPTTVASESHDSMPVVGTIIRAMQVIYVNRFLQSSRKHAVNEIKRKASCDQFPRVLLFPEGTTTNGRAIISFQLGAFIPGYPIQPVIVHYPHVHFDQSWGHISLAKLMFRMFTQFHNFMEIEYLPVVSPLENVKENAVQFAQRTSHEIATALNVVQTSHSYGDLMLLTKASEFKQEKPSLYMVEMAWIESVFMCIKDSDKWQDDCVSVYAFQTFHLSTFEAVDLLDKFLSMNPDSRGHVAIHDFFRVLRLKPCALSEKIFQFIDVQKTGKITFKQFLLGSAHILKQPLFRRSCELAFVRCDVKGTEYISKQELEDALELVMPKLDVVEIHGLFTTFDVDGDGIISKDDFITCLRQNPLLIALFSPQLLRRDLPLAEHGMVVDQMT